MPDGSISKRGNTTVSLGRATGDQAEQQILNLLRLRFTGPDDPGLARRRQALAEAFDLVRPERAAHLHYRLSSRRSSDEIAVRFRTLSTVTRSELLEVLNRKSQQYRQTIRATRSIRDDLAYIDNLFTQLQMGSKDDLVLSLGPERPPTSSLGSSPTTDNFRTPVTARLAQGRPNVIVVTKAEIYRGGAPQLFEKDTVFQNRRTALVEFVGPTLSRLRAQNPQQPVSIVVACFRGPGGIILPTLYTRISTPRVIATLAELEESVGRDEAQRVGAEREDAEAFAAMFRPFLDTFNILPIEVDERGNGTLSGNPVDWMGAALLLRRGRVPRAPKGRPSGGVARALQSGRGTARQVGRSLYAQLQRKGKVAEPRTRAIRPDASRYPSVEVRPNGDIFGSYSQLRSYLQEARLTGARRAESTALEAHHIVENRLLQPYGIRRNEGRSVAVEIVEHQEFSSELARRMPQNRSFYDIDDIVAAHQRMYRELDYPELVPQVRTFVRAHRASIRNMYVQGRVPGGSASDYPSRLRRVLTFLDGL